MPVSAADLSTVYRIGDGTLSPLVGPMDSAMYDRVLEESVIEVDGKEVAMTFVTNNLAWSAWTVAELYRARWEIEVFFKELKQTVQLVDFVGQRGDAAGHLENIVAYRREYGV